MSFKVDNFSFISSNVSIATPGPVSCSANIYLYMMIVSIIILPFNMCGVLYGFKAMITHKGHTSSHVLSFSMVITVVLSTLPGILIFFNIVVIGSVFALACLFTQAQFQTWICLEQYVAVIHPLFYLKLRQYRYGLVLASLTCLTSIVLAGVSRFLDLKHRIFLFLVLISVLLVVILFCNVATLAALKHQSPGGSQGREMHHKKLRAFKIITTNLVVLIIRFYPYIGVTYMFEHLPKTICFASLITVFILLIGSVYHSLAFISRFIKVPCNRLF